jgi:hypothetical protein
MSALDDIGQRTSTRQVCSLTCSSPNATSPFKVLTALVLEKKRRIPRRQQREVTMTANESNGGTEQPAAEPETHAAEPEAPATTEQQAAPQPAEPVAEQPPPEQAAVSPAEQAAAPTSDDAPTS